MRITPAEAAVYSVDTGIRRRGEGALYEAYKTAAAHLAMQQRGRFLTAFDAWSRHQHFFEAVLVNADDPAVRENRLGLLQAIAGLARGRADLSKLAGF